MHSFTEPKTPYGFQALHGFRATKANKKAWDGLARWAGTKYGLSLS